MIPYKFKGEVCSIFHSILHCALFSTESVLYFPLYGSKAHCVTINTTHRDTGMTTITHPNKVVNSVTIEINNKSMATHSEIPVQ